MKTKITLTIAFVLAMTLLLGCSTKSVNPVGHSDPNFMLRTSPENVLGNIVLAYEDMTADEYLDCLSLDFIFYPSDVDVQDPETTLPPEWYKFDETTMHERMFADSSDVGSISLTLTVSNSTFVEGIPGDPSDDVWIYTVDVDLRVHLSGGLTYLATTPSEFNMRIDQDQVGPGGEQLWEIFKWYDLGPVWARTEDSSWGVIKALYR